MSSLTADEEISALQREIRLRDEFIAVALHELRNPLTPISLEVEILLSLARRRPNASTTELASLERLQRGIKIFIRRANTFLDVTRIRSGSFQLQCRQVDLTSILNQVLANQSPLAAQAGCDVEVTAPAPIEGYWDPMALEEILENLISNAIRYGAGKPIRITLVQTGNVVELTVTDHGIGLPAENHERVFGLFERGEGGSRRTSGFGVGLWISREFARSMHGDIRVMSVPGHGASFTLRLPQTGEETAIHDDASG